MKAKYNFFAVFFAFLDLDRMCGMYKEISHPGPKSLGNSCESMNHSNGACEQDVSTQVPEFRMSCLPSHKCHICSILYSSVDSLYFEATIQTHLVKKC